VVPGCSPAGVVCACSVEAGAVVDARRVSRSPGVVPSGCSPAGVVCGCSVEEDDAVCGLELMFRVWGLGLGVQSLRRRR